MSTTLNIKPAAILSCASEFRSGVDELQGELNHLNVINSEIPAVWKDNTSAEFLAKLGDTISEFSVLIDVLKTMCERTERVAELYAQAEDKVKASI